MGEGGSMDKKSVNIREFEKNHICLLCSSIQLVVNLSE